MAFDRPTRSTYAPFGQGHEGMAFDRPTRADDDLHSNALSSLDADGLARLVPDPKVVAAAADGIVEIVLIKGGAGAGKDVPVPQIQALLEIDAINAVVGGAFQNALAADAQRRVAPQVVHVQVKIGRARNNGGAVRIVNVPQTAVFRARRAKRLNGPDQAAQVEAVALGGIHLELKRLFQFDVVLAVAPPEPVKTGAHTAAIPLLVRLFVLAFVGRGRKRRRGGSIGPRPAADQQEGRGRGTAAQLSGAAGGTRVVARVCVAPDPGSGARLCVATGPRAQAVPRGTPGGILPQPHYDGSDDA